MNPRTFCVGDIHGAHKALVQVLERAKFRKDKDVLITLGDICDGYSEVYECVEELLSIKNRIDIIGNHDEPFNNFCQTGLHDWGWAQGGEGTLRSYIKNYKGYEEPQMVEKHTTLMTKWITSLNPGDIPLSHQKFFRQQIAYYIDGNNNLFIHGGYDRDFPIKEQDKTHMCWDRSLWAKALSVSNGKLKTADNFNRIFLGHTATLQWDTDQPMESGGVWNLDTGAGFAGRLTLMNVKTLQYVQSDRLEELYPNDYGRRKKKYQ